MAELLDNCRFVAGSSGTADFVDGTEVDGCRNLEDAGAVGGETYPYKAQNATATQWERGYGTYDASAGTLSRDDIKDSSDGGAKVDFSTNPQVIISPTPVEFAPPNIPQASYVANHTLDATDANKHILHPSSDNNARTFTIDSDSNLPLPEGTVFVLVNKINVLTIAITSDTLTWAPTGGTGSRNLAANGIATAMKISSAEWIISGVGLT